MMRAGLIRRQQHSGHHCPGCQSISSSLWVFCISSPGNGSTLQTEVETADRRPQLSAIFAPFVRSGSVQSHAGYGLGLAITRRVVEAHRGSVSASNRTEGGLVVVMDLPEA
ncbi:MAG: hypothetical protein IPF44_11220 [Betaproteobacteria bacterium]|nr:hypothetical protein [Betaproteobacteria bacterium]